MRQTKQECANLTFCLREQTHRGVPQSLLLLKNVAHIRSMDGGHNSGPREIRQAKDFVFLNLACRHAKFCEFGLIWRILFLANIYIVPNLKCKVVGRSSREINCHVRQMGKKFFDL